MTKHPMDYIHEELRERGWSLSRLAVEMGGEYGLNLLALEMYDAVRGSDVRLGERMAGDGEIPCPDCDP